MRASSFLNMDALMAQPTLKQTLAQIDHWIRSGAASKDVETLAHETLLRASKHIPPAALRRVIVMLEKLRDMSEQSAAAPKAQSRSGRKSAAKVVRSTVAAVKATATPKAAPATKAAKAAKKRAGAPARTAQSKRAKNAAVQKAVVKQVVAKKSAAGTAPAKARRSATAGTSAAKATARVRAVRQPVAAKGR